MVGLKPIAQDLATSRSIIALAAALTWVGTGIGGIPMGWLADRIGMRLVGVIGACSVALGMFVSTHGGIWGIYVGHGLLIGLLGNGAFNAPLMTYTTRWFDRRRGTALALIMSGQYVAGVFWPSVFERIIAAWSWREAMLIFAAVELLVALPIILVFFATPPRPPAAGSLGAGPLPGGRVLGLHRNLVHALLTLGIFLCCVPMALPAHLVSFCTDIGISRAHGAAMLSVLLGCAFISRQFWGWASDRIGGLRAVLAGSACQAVALSPFCGPSKRGLLRRVAAAYGLGFAGIVPAYVLAIRELFPARGRGPVPGRAVHQHPP